MKGRAAYHLACGKSHSIVAAGDAVCLLSMNRSLIKFGLESGEVFSFGCNDEGQLGVSDLEPHSEPAEIRHLRGQKIIGLAAGAQHSMALTGWFHFKLKS